MSAPTVYEIFNDNSQKLGHCQTQILSWFPVLKKSQPEQFALEVAELLIDDIAIYCAGQKKNVPTPTFKLEDVASLKSVGGEMTRAEFPAALTRFAEQMDQIAIQFTETESGNYSGQEIAKSLGPRAETARSLASTFRDILAARTCVSPTPAAPPKPATL